jgi:predicted small lipoprotein YifL
MTKVFALLSIAAVFAFASCGEKKPEESAVDSVSTVVPEAAPMEDTATVAPAAGDSAKVEAPAAH